MDVRSDVRVTVRFEGLCDRSDVLCCLPGVSCVLVVPMSHQLSCFPVFLIGGVGRHGDDQQIGLTGGEGFPRNRRGAWTIAVGTLGVPYLMVFSRTSSGVFSPTEYPPRPTPMVPRRSTKQLVAGVKDKLTKVPSG
ncbi:unnamed protein product [Boreogadus saida]